MPFRRQTILSFIGLLFIISLTACTSELPQSTLNPRAANSTAIFNLFVPIFWMAVVVFVVVEAMLVYSVFRFRARDPKAIPYQLHGSTPLEIGWTIAPAVVLGVIFLLTAQTMNAVSNAPQSANEINVRVIGHQWWWEFQYPTIKATDGTTLTVASDLHFPAGSTVKYTLESADVIHSFWVPQLNGKTDLIPGHINRGFFTATQLGEYFGQCAEFCGAQHAQMRFRAFAQSDSDFQAWVKSQQGPAIEPTTDLGKAGKTLFAKSACVGCHNIAGVTPIVEGKVGPNLTHFGSRTTIAAAVLPNTSQNLNKWLHAPESIKPGNDMSTAMAQMMQTFSERDVEALVAYLESLK